MKTQKMEFSDLLFKISLITAGEPTHARFLCFEVMVENILTVGVWQEDKVEVLVLLDHSSWAFWSIYSLKTIWERIISEAGSRSSRPTTTRHSSSPPRSSPFPLAHKARASLYPTLVKHIQAFLTYSLFNWQHQCLLTRNKTLNCVHTVRVCDHTKDKQTHKYFFQRISNEQIVTHQYRGNTLIQA